MLLRLQLLTIIFGNLYFTKENFGSKYFKILTYKFYMLKVILTSTLLSLRVVKY